MTPPLPSAAVDGIRGGVTMYVGRGGLGGNEEGGQALGQSMGQGGVWCSVRPQ